MADYPTDIVQIHGTERRPDAGIITDQAVSGKYRFRQYYTETRYTWNVVHEVDGPDKDVILNHFENNSMNEFTFTFLADDSTHTVRYAAVPQEIPIPGTDRWTVVTTLVTV